MRCDFRTHRECACPAGTCNQQPRAVPLIAARRGDFIRFFGWAFIISLVSYWALSEADQKFKDEALDKQENISWVR
jgi:hypothetical protein